MCLSLKLCPMQVSPLGSHLEVYSVSILESDGDKINSHADQRVYIDSPFIFLFLKIENHFKITTETYSHECNLTKQIG